MVVCLRDILISYVLLAPILYIVMSLVSQYCDGNILRTCSFQFLTRDSGSPDIGQNMSSTEYHMGHLRVTCGSDGYE